MIEVLHTVMDGEDRLVRLGCTCGDPALALYNCKDDQILFCTHCGEITTRGRLFEEFPALSPLGQLIWLNVTNHAECPLINVSIPVTIAFDEPSALDGAAEQPAVVTKLSTDQCFLRFERVNHPFAPPLGAPVRLRAATVPLAGETPGRLEEILHPHGANGPTYYKIRLSLDSSQRRSDLELFFQSTCGLRYDWRVLLYADPAQARLLWRHVHECLPMARIEAAGSAAEFIHLFEEHNPDLSILPLEPSLMQRVVRQRAEGSRPPGRMLVLLHERSTEAMAQALRWGADDILDRNCRLADVQRAIQRCQKKNYDDQEELVTSAELNQRILNSPEHRDGALAEDDPELTHASRASGHAARPGSAAQIMADLVTVTEEETVHLICSASETHDANSSSHLARMSAYSTATARALGWPALAVHALSIASKLHDVGKLGVPDEILRKTGALTEDERRIMQQHTRLGHQILQNSASETIRQGAVIALRHHERHDGRGYPDGLAGDSIPIEARIVTMADVFDALTTARVYKPAWSNDQAFDFLRAQSGQMFDPHLVRVFLGQREEIERVQLQFLDDFRDVWTERRHHRRHNAPPVPLDLEIVLPEQTFHPYSLHGYLVNLSLGGLQMMLTSVSNDLFTSMVSARRYGRIVCANPAWATLDQLPVGVAWMDYFAVPDPNGCLVGLSFQKSTPELEQLIARLLAEP